MKNTIPGTSQPMPEAVIRAYYFALAAHAAVGQVRKYTGEPYINHPVAVLSRLLAYCGDKVTENMMQAALLHDVVEDTGVNGEVIRHHFGRSVWIVVMELTKATTPSFGNRAERHAFEVERLSRASWMAQTIKVADLMDNTVSIVERDPDFAYRYLPEKAMLLNVMKAALPEIREPAIKMLHDRAKQLGMETLGVTL